MRLIFLVLLLLFAAAHGTDYPFAFRLKNGTTVYPFAMQLKDIDIKGIRGESGVSEDKSEAKNVLEKAAGKVKKLKKKWDERKNTRKQKD